MRHAQYFNKKRKIRGHLWQGRFYSCALDEKHLYSAIRYVENNPKRSKLVTKSEHWKYSSAKAHIEKLKDPLLTNIADLRDIKNWRKYLREKGDEEIIRSIKTDTSTGRPCGNNKFVEELEEKTGLRLRPLAWGRPKK
jgi:putative transposase